MSDVESQLGDRRELAEKLPNDASASAADALLEELRQGGCYTSYETGSYVAYVWFDAGELKAEVWTHGQPREVVGGETLDEVRENVDFFYGDAEAG